MGIEKKNTVQVVEPTRCRCIRDCLKSSNKDGDESKSKDLSRDNKFALTIFPKSAEFIKPAEKTLSHPTARPNNKLV